MVMWYASHFGIKPFILTLIMQGEAILKDLLLFLVLRNIKLNKFVFWTVGWTKKQYEEI